MSVQMKALQEEQTKPFEWAGLACLYIPTRDVVQAAGWYKDVLRTQVSLLEPGSHAMLSMPGLGIFLVQTQIDSTVNYYKKADGPPQAAWCFSVKHIEALHRHMQDNGVRVTELVDRGGCGINFQFYDPDGNYFDVNDDHRLFIALDNVETEEVLLTRLMRKLGVGEPLADWTAAAAALATSDRLPCPIVLQGFEAFQTRLPKAAAALIELLEQHYAKHPERLTVIIRG